MANRQAKHFSRDCAAGCLGFGIGLLASGISPADAQDMMQNGLERAQTQAATAQAIKSAMEAEAVAYSPTHVRYFSKNQLYANGFPRPGAVPGNLLDNQMDWALDQFTKGQISLWYVSNGYALNPDGSRVNRGDLIELSGPLLTAANQARNQSLVNKGQALTNQTQQPYADTAGIRAAGETASAVGQGISNTLDAAGKVIVWGGLAYLALQVYKDAHPEKFTSISQESSKTDSSSGQQTASYEPQETSTSASYDEGAQARMNWEKWLAGLDAVDFRSGAFYWSAVRTAKPRRSCYGENGQSFSSFTDGCLAAQKFFDEVEPRRTSDKDYRDGWNSVQAPDRGQAGECAVIGIRPDDKDGGLTMRASEARGAAVVGVIPYNAHSISNVDCACDGENKKCRVTYNGVTGFVNGGYLFPN